MVEKIIPLEDDHNLVVMYRDTYITDGSETYMGCVDIRITGPNNEIILAANKVVITGNAVAVLQGDKKLLTSCLRQL